VVVTAGLAPHPFRGAADIFGLQRRGDLMENRLGNSAPMMAQKIKDGFHRAFCSVTPSLPHFLLIQCSKAIRA
jgi:hypothetical protein